MATIPDRPSSSTEAQPAWDIALLYPNQGEWSESEYLALDTGRLVELNDGNLKVLPMPTTSHQLILLFLVDLLRDFVSARHLGSVLLAPLAVRIRNKTFREPDIVFVSTEHRAWIGEQFWSGADLVMEIVSADRESQKRDYQEKRADYAALGIPEYWIVDPQLEKVTVLSLDGGQYRVHGEFAPGQQATSVLLPGFTVEVASVFAAGKNLP